MALFYEVQVCPDSPTVFLTGRIFPGPPIKEVTPLPYWKTLSAPQTIRRGVDVLRPATFSRQLLADHDIARDTRFRRWKIAGPVGLSQKQLSLNRSAPQMQTTIGNPALAGETPLTSMVVGKFFRRLLAPLCLAPAAILVACGAWADHGTASPHPASPHALFRICALL